MNEKQNVFMNYLEQIQTQELKDEAIRLLDLVPEYFWTIAASSSGKYHPTFALGEGGLVNHTKAAMKMAIEMKPLLIAELVDMPESTKVKTFDMAIVSLMFHDTFKQGANESGHTVHEHPMLAAEFIRNNMNSVFAEPIARAIESHMGQWNTNTYSDVVLPLPKVTLQKYVHLCDFLASRKDIDIKF